MMGEIAAKPIRKPLGLSLKYVAAPLGAAAIGARTVGAFREEGPAPLDLTAISQGAEAEAPTTDRFADTLAELEAIMSAGEGKYASEAKANLADYLANMNQYVASQAPAVRGAYDQLAAEAQREAAMAYARGQGAAGDVYGMYQDVAGQTAGYGAGEGLATGAGELAGLTGVSGEMATAPQELGAYGASLADYLGRSAGITRDDLAAAARSYQAAGIGSEAEMRNMAAGLAAQREYELGQNIAEYNEARRQELADLKSQLAVERMAYEQGLEVPTTKEQRDARRVQAERIWRDLDEDQQKAVLDLYITKEDYLAAFLRDPDSVSATVTGLTED